MKIKGIKREYFETDQVHESFINNSNRFIPITKNHVILKSKASFLVIESIDLHESTLQLCENIEVHFITLYNQTHINENYVVISLTFFNHKLRLSLI